MPIRHSIWRVGEESKPLKEGQLESEALLEDMIVAAPEMLSPEWMIIGRQENTGHGSRALAPDGALILIELIRCPGMWTFRTRPHPDPYTKSTCGRGYAHEDTDNLPGPDIIAAEIVENLQAALEQFQGVVTELDESTNQA